MTRRRSSASSNECTHIVGNPGGGTETVVVIGGGLAGIAAALTLSDRNLDVHLIEQESRLGGKVDELTIDGVTIPSAGDNFLARRPEVSDLAEYLGLERDLISPVARSPRIYRDGRLHPLPPNVLGIPATDDLTATGLISASGSARAAQDRVLPDDRPQTDESVGDLVRRRLGDEVLEYLVDPLLGGINAGDSDRLSLECGTPQLAELRAHGPSLLAAVEKLIESRPATPGPVFRSIRGGLCRLIEAAEGELRSRPNVSIELNRTATLERRGEQWVIDSIAADRVVIATPAFAAASLVDSFSRELSQHLTSMDYSSVAVAVITLPPRTLDIDQTISGVLIPRGCGLHVTAISFASHKWPDLAHDDRQILRVSVGRRSDTRWQALSDEALISVVAADASEVLDQHVPIGDWSIARWHQSLPQYDVGHARWLETVDAATAAFPGLTLVGAWRNGLGLPAVVASGQSV